MDTRGPINLRRGVALAALCAGVLAAPEPAAAEYGWAHHNGVLGGLGTEADYVFVDDPADDFMTGVSGTVEAWVYLEPTDREMTVVSKGLYNWELSITAERDLRFTCHCTSDRAGVELPLGRWTHVAVAWRWSDAFYYDLEVFVDGEWVYNGVCGSPSCPDVEHPLTIGTSLTQPDTFFEGMIDEVRVWDYARDEAHVALHRFVGLGDAVKANAAAAITAGTEYWGLEASWTMNDANFAYEYIGGHHGTFEGTSGSVAWDLPPIPYNQALRCSGGKGDYVVVPDDSAVFHQLDGSVDMWVRIPRFHRSALFSRGKDFSIGTDGDGAVTFRFGANHLTSSTTLDPDRWTHVAATWEKLDSFKASSLAIYIDGVLAGSTLVPETFPVTLHDVWIGHAPAGSIRPLDGYIDEVRWWHGARDQDAIRRMMFSSGRGHGGTADAALGLWNFEGNLYNHLDYDISGSLNNGLANDCRFSAYLEESLGGAFGPHFTAHPTVLNRTRAPGANRFPSSYHLSTPFVPIVAGQVATDVITVPTTSPDARRFEVMLALETDNPLAFLACSVEHLGVTYQLFGFGASAASGGVLSFFGDDFAAVQGDADYPAPWGFVAPADSLTSTTGDIVTGGDWTLSCGTFLSSGTIEGWALRFEHDE